MNYSEDYKNIRVIIDEIIGVDTKQGSNLKMAIKKYFELKPIDVKLVKNKDIDYSYNNMNISKLNDTEMENALNNYTSNIKEDIKKMKSKGDWRGVSS